MTVNSKLILGLKFTMVPYVVGIQSDRTLLFEMAIDAQKQP